MRLRDRWRAGHPEFVVLVGSALGVGGNVAWIAWVLLSGGASHVPTALAVSVTGLVMCTVAPLPLRGGPPRTAMRFGIAGLAASIGALLTPPGLIGGGIALAGAVWGIVAADRHAA